MLDGFELEETKKVRVDRDVSKNRELMDLKRKKEHTSVCVYVCMEQHATKFCRYLTIRMQ